MTKKTESAIYIAIEMIKNGIFFDTRYKATKLYINPPVVWVMTNNYPDMSLLSQDRWKLWTINETTGELKLDENVPTVTTYRKWQLPQMAVVTETPKDKDEIPRPCVETGDAQSSLNDTISKLEAASLRDSITLHVMGGLFGRV